MRSTKNHIHINASCEEVFRALTEPESIAKWRVPDGMSCEIHYFEKKEGGTFRISLTYEESQYEGKSSRHTDTYHGYFKKLTPHQEVIEVMEFETEDPGMRGEMTSTILLTPQNGGTDLKAVHEGLPPGLNLQDNEEGWRQSLEKLARLLENSKT